MKVTFYNLLEFIKKFEFFLKDKILFGLFVVLFMAGCNPEKISPPLIGGIVPTSGSIFGGNLVTISGSGFASGALVTIGTTSCNVVNINSSQITCTSTANAPGSYDISVINRNRQSAKLAIAYTYRIPPIVTSVSPSSGFATGSTAVTISGSGFNAGATASFGGTSCSSLTVLNPTTITCTTAAHAAGFINIVITNTDAQVGTGISAYKYVSAPTVTSVAANAGALAGGSVVTISGSGFLAGAMASFGGSLCTALTVVNPTTITCTTAAHAAGLINVVVTNTDTQFGTGLSTFTYQAAPTVTSVAPTSGFAIGSTAVTITGSGFIAGATASFGGSLCTVLTVVNPTTITCTTAAHAA
ncbi:MAG: IPT/TIG domain-containing protein, partial [Bacteriovorax sp.]|nr:IPT/TIG domain-containing protein [Bacteriovorax sp.]